MRPSRRRALGPAAMLLLLAGLLAGPPAGGALLDYEYGGALAQLGRLRMLTERLSKQNVLYQLHLGEQSKVQIIETARLIQETLDLLRDGRPLLTVPEPPTRAIREQLRVIEGAWVPLQRMALASPFDYLRRSRDFLVPRDDRGDPLMIVHFDDLARRVIAEADAASALYIADCKREGWERCELAGVSGIPAMLVERVMKETVLVFAGLEAEQNVARLAASRAALDEKLAVTAASSVLKGTISPARGESGVFAAGLWRNIEAAWRRMGDEIEMVIQGHAEERNLRQAVSVQVLLVTDMQRLAVELYQYAAEGG